MEERHDAGGGVPGLIRGGYLRKTNPNHKARRRASASPAYDALANDVLHASHVRAILRNGGWEWMAL